jgi:ABC-type branched-subunit amino acid transport system substrate-binding protein
MLVKKSAQADGVNIVGDASYPLGATDYSNAISSALAGKPDAIYLSSATAIILPVLKQLRQAGYTGPVFHSAGITADQAQAILGANYNTLMTNNYDCAGTLPGTSTNAATKAFATAFQARWHQYPEDLTMWAYDYPFVVASAMTKAGSVTDTAKIYQALQQIQVPTGTVSGWVPGAGGLMFTDRDARTPSEVTEWCPDQKTLASAMKFDAASGTVTSRTVVPNACASAG